MVVQKLKQWWNNFKTQFKTEVRTEKQVKSEDIKDINEALDEDRGYKAGKAKEEERKRKSLEKSVSEERDQNVASYLQEQKQKLQQQNYDDATSISKMVKIGDRNDIDLLSRNLQKKFGTFDDFWLMKNGQLALVAETENGDKRPIAFGKDFTDILRNPAGLRREVQNGILTLNVNSEGKPVESPEGVKVPDIIMGPDGEWTFTESHTEEYMMKVGNLKSQLSSVRQREGAKEKALVKLNDKVNELQRKLEVSESEKDSLSETLDRRLEEMKNITSEYDSMQSEMARMTQHKQMSEDLVKEVISRRDEFSSKIAERINKEDMDVKEDEIRRILSIIGEMDELNASQTGENVEVSQEGNE